MIVFDVGNAFVTAPVQLRQTSPHVPRQRSFTVPRATSAASRASAAGVAAAVGLVVAARPKRRCRELGLTRMSLAASSGKNIVLTGDTLQCALKMRCDIAEADYAIYWTRVGNDFVVAGEYITPAQQEVLAGKGLNSFEEVHVGKLDANGENAVATVAASQYECFIPEAEQCTIIGQDGVGKYGIASICFVPIEGGVLEYGVTKDGPTTWEVMPVCPVLPKKKMRECFENFGASYAVFWMESDGWFSAKSDYVTPRRRRELKSARGDDKTFCSEVMRLQFAADGNDTLAVAARSGKVSFVASADEEPHAERKALLQEFGVSSVYFVPVQGGVLELGTPDTAGLSGNTLQASLKMCCDATGASYALYWTKNGDEFCVKDSYVPPAALAKLQAEGKTGSFAEASKSIVLKTDEESAVGMVSDSGCSCFIPDIESHSMYFCRTAEAEEYGINTICLLPVEGGVLEYGKNKQDMMDEGVARKRLNELLAEKNRAFQEDDYDRCKELKPEIDELTLKLGTSDWSGVPATPPVCPEFPKAEMRKAIDEMKASYILFWQKHGNHYTVTADYMDPVLEDELRRTRGDNETYATKTHSFKLPIDGDGCVPTAVRAGKELIIENAQSDATFKRQDLAKEFKIGTVHLVPCADGVFEYCLPSA